MKIHVNWKYNMNIMCGRENLSQQWRAHYTYTCTHTSSDSDEKAVAKLYKLTKLDKKTKYYHQPATH